MQNEDRILKHRLTKHERSVNQHEMRVGRTCSLATHTPPGGCGRRLSLPVERDRRLMAVPSSGGCHPFGRKGERVDQVHHQKVLLAILTVFIICAITFFLMHAIPGGPFNSEKALSPATIAALNARYNLDKPTGEQFFIYVRELLKGDFFEYPFKNGANFLDNRRVFSRYPQSSDSWLSRWRLYAARSSEVLRRLPAISSRIVL